VLSESPAYAHTAILNVEEVAAYLRMSAATVRHYCHLVEGQPDRMPNFRMGKAIRIPFWGLQEWIARRSGCGLPAPEARRIIKSKPRRTARRR
jgi:hypothetical protein